jgi:hypothetical protein
LKDDFHAVVESEQSGALNHAGLYRHGVDPITNAELYTPRVIMVDEVRLFFFVVVCICVLCESYVYVRVFVGVGGVGVWRQVGEDGGNREGGSDHTTLSLALTHTLTPTPSPLTTPTQRRLFGALPSDGIIRPFGLDPSVDLPLDAGEWDGRVEQSVWEREAVTPFQASLLASDAYAAAVYGVEERESERESERETDAVTDAWAAALAERERNLRRRRRERRRERGEEDVSDDTESGDDDEGTAAARANANKGKQPARTLEEREALARAAKEARDTSDAIPLEAQVSVWSDFLRPRIHTETLHQTPAYTASADDDVDADAFALHAPKGVAAYAREADALEDRVRRFVEEMDVFGGLQMLTDSGAGWSAFGAAWVGDLYDVYGGKCAQVVVGCGAGEQATRERGETGGDAAVVWRRAAARTVHRTLMIQKMCEFATAYVPLQAPDPSQSLYMSSALLALAVRSLLDGLCVHSLFVYLHVCCC